MASIAIPGCLAADIHAEPVQKKLRGSRGKWIREVSLNGRCVGRDVSGYAPIHFDMTTNVIAGGTNVLVARVDTLQNEGWFYEGGGIWLSFGFCPDATPI
jgi:hypothetical protein